MDRALNNANLLAMIVASVHLCPQGGAVAEWVRASTGDRMVDGSSPTAENFSLRNFGNSVYPALPVSFGGDSQSCRSLLSGGYARGSKRPHQSALECVGLTVVDSTAHSKSPRSASMQLKTLPCTEKENCFVSLHILIHKFFSQ